MNTAEMKKVKEVEAVLDDEPFYEPMTVADLRAALKGLPGDMPVEMCDERPVTLAEVSGSVFVISDPDPTEEEEEEDDTDED